MRSDFAAVDDQVAESIRPQVVCERPCPSQVDEPFVFTDFHELDFDLVRIDPVHEEFETLRIILCDLHDTVLALRPPMRVARGFEERGLRAERSLVNSEALLVGASANNDGDRVRVVGPVGASVW